MRLRGHHRISTTKARRLPSLRLWTVHPCEVCLVISYVQDFFTHSMPLPGETIPIRLFLGGFDLTPTFRDVNKKFSTRYYLNLVLIDEENRRYFKQQVHDHHRTFCTCDFATDCLVGFVGDNYIPNTRGQSAVCRFVFLLNELL